jgi:hypothetical protein
LAKRNEQVAETNISKPHPPISSALCTMPTAREVGVVKPLRSPVHARAPPEFTDFRAKLPRGISFASLLLPALFLPNATRLQAASSR